MITMGLRFFIIFIDILVGVAWNEQMFSEETWKLRGSLKIMVSALAALGMSIFERNNFFDLMLAIVLVAVIVGVSRSFFRANLKHLIAHTCFYLGIVYLADISMKILSTLMGQYFLLPEFFCVVLLLVSKFILIAGIFILPIYNHRLQVINKYYNSMYGTPIAAFIGVALLCSLTFSYDDKKMIFILWVILSVLLFLRILLTYNWIKYQREKDLLATIAMQKELLENNYMAVNRAYSVNAKVFHDFHKHIEILQQMAHKRKDIELSDYIETIRGPLTEISTIIWTGNETLDYIINSRYSTAKEQGIDMAMNIEFPYNTNIQANDLCTILSNLLDNALESCARVDLLKQKFINLTIRRIQNILIVKLENSSQEPSYHNDSELITHKEDNMLHGWGMKNIESAVLKYDGIIQSSYADHVFQTIITFSFDGVELN